MLTFNTIGEQSGLPVSAAHSETQFGFFLKKAPKSSTLYTIEETDQNSPACAHCLRTDALKKRSMELRLLHGVAYGQPWFGRWHYGFCRGSFGVTELNYEIALEDIGSLELDRIIRDFSETEQGKEIKERIHLYRDLCETQLITIHDLLKFMLTVRSRPIRKPIMAASMNPSSSSSFSLISKPSTRTTILQQTPKPFVKDSKPAEYKKFSTIIANTEKRWTKERLEKTADEIVSALKEKERCSGNGGITRKVVRNAMV